MTICTFICRNSLLCFIFVFVEFNWKKNCCLKSRGLCSFKIHYEFICIHWYKTWKKFRYKNDNYTRTALYFTGITIFFRYIKWVIGTRESIYIPVYTIYNGVKMPVIFFWSPLFTVYTYKVGNCNIVIYLPTLLPLIFM